TQVRFIRDFYSDRYTHLQADLVVSRHVLEHSPAPHELLGQLRRATGDRLDTVVFFEVPNVLYTLRDLGIWDIIYEHVSYFSPGSLAQAFRGSGFESLRLGEEFGGQYLTIEARPARTEQNEPPAWEGLADMARLVSDFAGSYRQKLAAWGERLERARRLGQKAVVWSAGSKGVSFLNVFKDSGIEWVIDVNPRKHGRFIPGAGQEIRSPAFLQTYRPDLVFVMNPIYAAEIEAMAAGYGLRPEFIQV
ncbi:MAG: methyltransferase domain-containing protein, partial [Chloroflexota bacterium]